MEPAFLTLAEIIEIHSDQIERYGGNPGLRDMGLLKSAMATPSAWFGGCFLHEDIFEMAAAYLFHIVKNHPFIDGNKRTGLAAAVIFLDMNGIEVDVSEEMLVKIVIETAEGKNSKTEIFDFFRKYSRLKAKK